MIPLFPSHEDILKELADKKKKEDIKQYWIKKTKKKNIVKNMV
jgi:hypothetical protein